MFFSSEEFKCTIDMALSLLGKMVWTPSIVPKFEVLRLFYRQNLAISKACRNQQESVENEKELV